MAARTLWTLRVFKICRQIDRRDREVGDVGMLHHLPDQKSLGARMS